MAESSVLLSLDGGFVYDFVDSVPESLSCAVCLLPFRDPHLVSCCGARFCEPCIGRVKAADQSCPLCKQDFVSMLDRGYQRKVLNLQVICKKNGCQWVGELRHLEQHQRDECGWAVVECSYQCGAHLPRRLMDEHEHGLCPQRPMDGKLEWIIKSMETKLTNERDRHESDMAAMREAHNKQMEEVKQMLAEQKEETAGLKNEINLLKVIDVICRHIFGTVTAPPTAPRSETKSLFSKL